MDHRVLPWQGNGVAYTNAREDLAMMMEAGKGVVELIEGWGIDVGTAGDIAEVEEGRQTLNDVVFYIIYDGRDINLSYPYQKGVIIACICAHLHQGFRVISRPLLEASPMRKAPEAWERWRRCYSVAGMSMYEQEKWSQHTVDQYHP